jgi:hypothetical protein
VSTSVSHNFDSEALGRRFRAALAEGTLAVMVRLQNEIVEMLSRRGSGKMYIRGQNPFASGAARRTAAVSAITAGGNLRNAGYHQASAPGEPPAPDTGNLRRNVQLAKPEPLTMDRNTVGWRLSIGVIYGRALEYGYPPRGLAPRPYVKPSIANVKPLAVQMIVSGLNAAGFRSRAGK